MFGPDKCGEDYKLHFIFRHQNRLNKDVEEKHAKRADVDLKKFYTDKKTHLYTLGWCLIQKDNVFMLLCLMVNVWQYHMDFIQKQVSSLNKLMNLTLILYIYILCAFSSPSFIT